MLPLVSPQKRRLRNDRRDDVLTTCHYLDLGSASDWLEQFFFNQLFTEAYASAYHQWLLCFVYPLFLLVLLVPLIPLFPFCFPCSPSPCSPLFFCSPCSPLFPFVPLFPLFALCSPLFPCSPCPPLFLLFALFPLVPPCSRLFPYSLLFPLSPFVSLVAPCAPCSPVPLVCLQFTTLNVWQPQISVNKKNRSPLRGSPLKSRIPSHKHVTEKVLHLIWWRQLVQEIRKVRAKLRENETNVSPKLLRLYQLCEVTGCVRVFLPCFLLDKKSLPNKQLKK